MALKAKPHLDCITRKITAIEAARYCTIGPVNSPEASASVVVVRALINRPRLLLADEPTGSLNQEGAKYSPIAAAGSQSRGRHGAGVGHAFAIAERTGRVLGSPGDGQLRPRSLVNGLPTMATYLIRYKGSHVSLRGAALARRSNPLTCVLNGLGDCFVGLKPLLAMTPEDKDTAAQL